MPGSIVQHPSSERPSVTLNQALRASLAARRGVSAGQTFGEFLAAVRALGVTDDMQLSSIEFGVSQAGAGYITVDTDDHGIEISEGI